jgi:hypothetical protein
VPERIDWSELEASLARAPRSLTSNRRNR